MTSCHHLPSIFGGSGLLSLNQRRLLGIQEETEPHYWGSADKQEAFADYVVCAFMPPWWMCQRHTDELAIVVLDAHALCTSPGTRFCPMNSAFNDYPAEVVKGLGGLESFNACFQNPDTYQAHYSEIFVRDRVEIAAFRTLIFCDDEAKAYWLPRVKEAYSAVPRADKPPEPIKIQVGYSARFGFPGNFVPTQRIRHG
jgi:hypothetical protein